MATRASVLAWRIPWTEEPCWLQSMGSQESDMTEPMTEHTCITSQLSFPRGTADKGGVVTVTFMQIRNL